MPKKDTRRGRKPVRLPELRRTYGDLDFHERLSLAAKWFCDGKTPSQIQALLSDRFNEDVRREEPYRLLQLGGAMRLFKYTPPQEEQLRSKLLQAGGLGGAEVLQTQALEHVTERAAEVLLSLIQKEWESKLDAHAKTGFPSVEEANTVRIGLAGGHTVLGIVRSLAELLKREDPQNVPEQLGFHTACTGIHYHDSSTDPNSFVSHLLGVQGIDTRTFAVPYQAPPIMQPDTRKMLEREPVMKEAARQFELVDILVTGGSSWRTELISDTGEIGVPTDSATQGVDGKPDPLAEPYSQLEKLMRQDKQGYRQLLRAGTVADMLWQPLTFDGPPQVDTKVRAMTLAPLSDLPAFMESGMKVLLALGPYGPGGMYDKADVLVAAFGGVPQVGYAGPLFTHLVCDHRTARAAVKAMERAKESSKA